jgi:hypothetical protein
VTQFFSIFFLTKKWGRRTKHRKPNVTINLAPQSEQKQQSALLASAVSTTEMAKKPKAVAAEATPLSCPPPAEVAQEPLLQQMLRKITRKLMHYQSMQQC